jgi:hypothetical protein
MAFSPDAGPEVAKLIDSSTKINLGLFSLAWNLAVTARSYWSRLECAVV